MWFNKILLSQFENLMGEGKKDALRVIFDNKVKLECHGMKVTSDAGLLAYGEIDDVFGLTDMAVYELTDNRTGRNTQHSITALLRQSVYSRLAGYEDTNDAERLCVDPIFERIKRLKPVPIGYGYWQELLKSLDL